MQTLSKRYTYYLVYALANPVVIRFVFDVVEFLNQMRSQVVFILFRFCVIALNFIRSVPLMATQNGCRCAGSNS